jgi:hypothetical protein
LGKRRTVEIVNGGNNSIDSENTNPCRKAIHIHGGMKHNLAEYAKYYSCGHKKLGCREFIRETDHNRRDFSRHW